jgi:hypothetical protein
MGCKPEPSEFLKSVSCLKKQKDPVYYERAEILGLLDFAVGHLPLHFGQTVHDVEEVAT